MKKDFTRVILQDGTAYSKVTISDMEKDERENLIADTFIRFYEDQYQKKLPRKLVQRDKRHDFTYQDENGKLMLEIVAVTDTDSSIKNQNFRSFFEKELSNVKGGFLIYLPPSTKKSDIEPLLKTVHQSALVNVDEFLSNPFSYGKYPYIKKISEDGNQRIFLTRTVNENNLHELIVCAIHSKEQKNYPEQDEMVLLIDDRSIKYDRRHIFTFLDPVIEYAEKSPFNEIFLCSIWHVGQHGEVGVSVYPIKSLHDKNLKIWKFTNKTKNPYIRFLGKCYLYILSVLTKSIHKGKPHP